MTRILKIVAAVLFTVFSIAASASAVAAEHDYKLEREGCCGGNQ